MDEYYENEGFKSESINIGMKIDEVFKQYDLKVSIISFITAVIIIVLAIVYKDDIHGWGPENNSLNGLYSFVMSILIVGSLAIMPILLYTGIKIYHRKELKPLYDEKKVFDDKVKEYASGLKLYKELKKE